MKLSRARKSSPLSLNFIKISNIAPVATLAFVASFATASHARIVASAAASSQSANTVTAQTGASQQTPSGTVREFYRLMRERRFREAFMLSIFRPAIEDLSAQEFESLRPDFERQALEVPAEVVLTGEQMSGDEATVFMKLGTDEAPKVTPVFLMKDKSGRWIIGDAESQKIVEKRGKKFFFEARIEAHHDDVESMMRRIATAQLIYSSQRNGEFGDLAALVSAGLVPQDILQTASTGYRFHVTPDKGGKGFRAGAEPAAYGQTGRLSFYIDHTGAFKKEDKGGKPLKGS